MIRILIPVFFCIAVGFVLGKVYPLVIVSARKMEQMKPQDISPGERAWMVALALGLLLVAALIISAIIGVYLLLGGTL